MHRLLCIAILLLSACGSLDATQSTAEPQAIYNLEAQEAAPPASEDSAAAPGSGMQVPIIAADDVRSLGNPDAPVTIIEYSDFQCPFCFRHTQETFPLIKANYIDSGKVRYVFRNFIAVPQHTVAPAAAVASLCAAEQDMFWPMHDRLFKQPDQWYIIPDNATIMFQDYARTLNLDEATFAQCLERPDVARQVEDETLLALDMGMRGTPGFLVGRYFINGAQDYTVFASAIETALADGERQ